ncbi:MAG: uroporphyrinogen-III C-methyltransferase [Candidatus Acidiferrales bacterium]
MSTTVYLVGAGPGDPDLLTRKALRLLQCADVVLHDDLVSPEILQLIRSGALVQNVGKRCGRKRITQQQIHARMIDAARRGKIVVRLQGGDPLLYGRAGEEMDALRKAGIDFEVVPGITAAFAAAAAAKIPLTDRRLASKVVFLTAHHCKEDVPEDFGSAISSDSTLAIYMPGHDYARLQNQLLASGVDPETPCLLTSRAMRPGESFHATVVGKLSLAPRVSSPSILLVGLLAKPPHHTNAVIAFSRIEANQNYSAPENIPLQCASVLGDGPAPSPTIRNSGRGC